VNPSGGAEPNKVRLNTTFPRIPDWNGDGRVDSEDLLILCGGRHTVEGGPRCDITGDRETDGDDMLLVGAWWGRAR